MKAREIMTQEVITVRTTTPVKEAAALLAGHGITSMPVLDDADRVVGIISEVDVIRDRMPHDPRSHLRPEYDSAAAQADPARLVREVMSDTVACLGENADAADLAELMLEYNVRAVPIVDGGHLVGIVSRRDLLRTLLRDDKAIRDEVLVRLGEFAGTPDRWSVKVGDGVVAIGGRFTDEEEAVIALLAQTVPGVVRVHTRRRFR